jgi:hypothetical protein
MVGAAMVVLDDVAAHAYAQVPPRTSRASTLPLRWTTRAGPSTLEDTCICMSVLSCLRRVPSPLAACVALPVLELD